ncbi:hypothetical protein [Paenibacillus sp. Marseille-Q4541]|uniref:hypothetical protein n=1 Tax=Paenibacillus sp. Marseille-Q4541 TaxID=2831522 RepID=UPI001BAD6A6C|nr:hypothetical protein [Paenibacillus sp. Marseille-Q4541]
MIEMDEEEYLESTVSDEFLYMVLMLLGPEVRDQLLYSAVGNVRSSGGYSSYAIQERPYVVIGSGGRFSFAQTEEDKEKTTEIPTLPLSG